MRVILQGFVDPIMQQKIILSVGLIAIETTFCHYDVIWLIGAVESIPNVALKGVQVITRAIPMKRLMETLIHVQEQKRILVPGGRLT